MLVRASREAVVRAPRVLRCHPKTIAAFTASSTVARERGGSARRNGLAASGTAAALNAALAKVRTVGCKEAHNDFTASRLTSLLLCSPVVAHLPPDCV